MDIGCHAETLRLYGWPGVASSLFVQLRLPGDCRQTCTLCRLQNDLWRPLRLRFTRAPDIQGRLPSHNQRGALPPLQVAGFAASFEERPISFTDAKQVTAART